MRNLKHGVKKHIIYVTEGSDFVKDFLNSIKLLLVFLLDLWKKTKFGSIS